MLIVVSGAPATGKSTIAREVAKALDLPLIDKDDILEHLFDALGVGDQAWRARLSRASDAIFLSMISELRCGVAVSFWRHDGQRQRNSGTPVDLLRERTDSVIELHCRCEEQTALDRFKRRRRHPGHLDKLNDGAGHLGKQGFLDQLAHGPLNVGRTITVDTGNDVDTTIHELIATLKRNLAEE